ncbi:MAG: hypothetical protein M3Y87_36635 [Myxococcota bacterium]|nr:hypothetical protein [Myxococcota bacterium]
MIAPPVGELARQRRGNDPRNTISSAKRIIGRPFTSYAAVDRPLGVHVDAAYVGEQREHAGTARTARTSLVVR